MGTINSAFSIIAGALNADQSGLSIIAGNVANANTPGYTRQRPTFHENSTVTINGRSFGTGVLETGAQSIRDRVLMERLDQQQQVASASGARLSALNLLQNLFTPASGSNVSAAGDIGTDITSFFNSFASLEANPGNNALRQQVLSSGKMLAADISNTASSVNAQRAAVDREAAGVASQVNALTASIATLNQQIQSMSAGGDAGTLEDERQQDLNQLSQLIGINQITTENNGLTITTTAGQTLVSEGVATRMTTGIVGGVTHFFIGANNDVTIGLTGGGGQLGGYLTARDQDIPQVMGQLDQLAFGISVEVNAQNAKGIDLNGNAGAAIFSQSTTMAGSAMNMKVVMTDPNQIAAAAVGQGTGDNTNAIALAQLGTQVNPAILNGLTLPDGTTLAGGQTLLTGQTPSGYFSGFVISLGSTVAQVETENTAENASVTQLQTMNNSLSQVNLNDEASALTTLERSYQAASRVFGLLNSIMSSALNLGQQTAVS
ncbi:flagellar hook-associated protein FlgK [Occallatibacter riparius]|uniref:Flagellar hook-associated protein 1 n=1 Tax=Occallatibacter riparius TaxID=1002689 RepID=A0A9J7BK52_9BACT|nr:flagellar hook-associated protein FlgK [Occallatibacter riparius]UWZ82939.1 flagellar hook-associated protein FlgK [Occallatibacter riparius]